MKTYKRKSFLDCEKNMAICFPIISLAPSYPFHTSYRFYSPSGKVSGRGWGWWSLPYFIFLFTPEWGLIIKCIYEISWLVCVWTIVLSMWASCSNFVGFFEIVNAEAFIFQTVSLAPLYFSIFKVKLQYLQCPTIFQRISKTLDNKREKHYFHWKMKGR